MKLLIVDDAIVARKMIQRHLAGSAYASATIIEAASAEQALEKFDDSITVVLSDWNMPGMDGIELVKRLRELEGEWGRDADAQIPIIMITTEGTAQKVNLAKESGVDHYITKPFSAEQLVKVLDSLE